MSVEVFALAPFGVVVTFVLALDDASGVETPVFTDVSEVGFALWRLALMDAFVSDTGEAAFMPVDVALGVVVLVMPVVPVTPGLVTWPAALVVLMADGGVADVAALVAPCTTPPTCAKADVENATAPHSSAVRMMVFVISFPRCWISRGIHTRTNRTAEHRAQFRSL